MAFGDGGVRLAEVQLLASCEGGTWRKRGCKLSLSISDRTGSGYIPLLSSSGCTLLEGSIAMKSMNRKWWLALVLSCLALTTACPVEDAKKSTSPGNQPVKHVAVPEGGSSVFYVLGAAVVCLGAMLVRFGSAKPKES
jgi:hypothetical protein